MSQLEEIKTQIAELAAKVNTIKETQGDYSFTKDELVTFVGNIIDTLKTKLDSEIQDLDFSDVDVSLDIYGKSIETNVDSSEIAGIIESNIDLDVDVELLIAQFARKN